jgi:DEAD/DEAH box helicase domain-containing protein
MSLRALLETWRREPGMASVIVDWRLLPGHPARWMPFPDDLHPALCDALRASGIRSLYSHQAAAWQAVQAGQHPVIVSGTASGKTLCYTLPVVDRLLREPAARALYLFPTKALAQDQKDELARLITALPEGAAPPVPATYDGDTPADARAAIRNRARVIISNPDMLHTGILPHHTAWAEFFQGLRYVVLDEMHTYRGVFGSHVANVMRRLKRVARFYGAAPQFILTSATIANPAELAAGLIEEPVSLIRDDGAPRADRHFIIYNPPVVDRELGLRRSALLEAVRLAQDLLHHGAQTIVFGRTRRAVELMLTYLRQGNRSGQVSEVVQTSEASVRGYRSGYLPRQRRDIENGLREGQVRAVVATSALELGIDIGGLDAVVLAGYPGTIAGTWQQAGRAGRQDRESLAVLVASAGPLDQYLANHSEYFFSGSPEQALVNADHLLILLKHIRCAAFELPFQVGECFGGVEAVSLQEYLDFLQEAGDIHRSGHKFFWMADRYPARDVSLRSASPDTVVLHSLPGDADAAPVVIGQVDRPSAPWMVHPQAIYLHEGQTYLVETLDLEQNAARLRPVATDYYTEPHTQTTVDLVAPADTADVPGGTKGHGDLTVTRQVVGFSRIQWFTHQRLDEGEVSLPPDQLATTGYWLALDEATVAALRDAGVWTNDPNAYGPNWEQQRRRARERDRFRCQVCGAPEQGRAHDVHHKTPFRTLAGYLQANQLSNLITLCPACHQRAELAVRTRSGLAGLAFALGHLAPLSLMCDARDLGTHCDLRLSFAGDRPGVVIYDQVPAGIGFSQRLFELHTELMQRARELVTECPCGDGCPSCVGPAGEQSSGGKRETLAILEHLAPEGLPDYG